MGIARRRTLHRRRDDNTALSVLSAVEGLKLVTPALSDYVVPIAVVSSCSSSPFSPKVLTAVSNFFGR